jgi:CBS domain-containing protein
MAKIVPASQLPPSVRPFVPQPLELISQKIAAGETNASVDARSLLKWFGYERRTPYAVDLIRRALATLRLVTVPDFESAYIDGPIDFVRAPETRPGAQETVTNERSGSGDDDPTFRLGKLAASNSPPVFVRPDDEVSTAVTTMMLRDFSQLPAMTNERTVKGVVTWASIGSKLALTSSCAYVRECYDTPPEILSHDTSLFVAVDHITRRGFVLVQDDTKCITGIVTAADVTEIFRDLGEPFLLLGEIESYLRRLLNSRFSGEELRIALDPTSVGREVTSAANLSFGEYIRFLEMPDKWRALAIKVSRGVFLGDLETIRKIRNDVMHFDPDGLAPNELHTLRTFAQFMRSLAHCGALQASDV